jgi:hypothetical protein
MKQYIFSIRARTRFSLCLGRAGAGLSWAGAGGSLARYSATATIRVYSGGQAPKDAALHDPREIIRQLGPTIVMPEVRPG